MTKKKKIIIACVAVLVAAAAVITAIVLLKKKPEEPAKKEYILKLEAGEYTAAYSLVETEEEKILVKNENLAAICVSVTLNKFQLKDAVIDGVWINEDYTLAVVYLKDNYFLWSINKTGRFDYIGSHKGALDDPSAESEDSEYDNYTVNGKIIKAQNSDHTNQISAVVIDENKLGADSIERINALVSNGSLSDPNAIFYVGNKANNNA